MIFSNDYSQLSDIVFLSEQSIIDTNLLNLHSKLIYCSLDIIHILFRRLEQEDIDIQFTLVSAQSDFGLEYQETNPLWIDMQKWLSMMTIPTDLKYKPLILPSRGDIENCKITDNISVKMYSWTRSTFNKIPRQIKRWYCVNANINDDKIKHIPFGLPEWGKCINFSIYKNKFKHSKIYVNFQLNNIDRATLKRSLKHHPNFFVRDNEISYEEYLDEMSGFQFVLAPPGNGLQSFRTLESCMVNSYPIILNQPCNKAYDLFPVIKVDSWAELNSPIEFFQNKIRNCIPFDSNIIPSKVKDILF